MDLFWLILIIGIISRLVKSDKKKKQTQRSARQDFGRGFEPGTAQKAQAPKPGPVREMMPPRPEPAQPLVHTHLEPECEEHDMGGSLDFVSSEGQDDCHADQLPSARQPRAAASAGDEKTQSGLQLDWSGDSMMKAVIMQEVLTRPCDRRRRG